MLLNQIAKHFPVREVTYEPDQQKFTFTTKKGVLIFGFIWCALLLIVVLFLLFSASIRAVLQVVWYFITKKILTKQDRITARDNLMDSGDYLPVVAFIFFLALFIAEAKALHHLLLRVTILGETGIIRRNSRYFNSSRELWTARRIRSRSGIELRCSRTSMLILSDKTDHYDQLIEA